VSSPREEESSSEMEESAYQLRVFRGLPKALGRLLLRDGRSRKEIAEAAGLNASMLSGFCSGRRMPSLEHLDRLLNELGVGLDELNFELLAMHYRGGILRRLPELPRSTDLRERTEYGVESATDRVVLEMQRLEGLFETQSEQFAAKMDNLEERLVNLVVIKPEVLAAPQPPPRKKKK
jgi:transcriptional regulator with XRE-family HTH domain